MNITLSQEPVRIDQDFYKTLTPLKRKTFSEAMLIRRSPFLNGENRNSQKSLEYSQKKLKYTENEENPTKNKNNLKSKEENKQNDPLNTSPKTNRQKSRSSETPLVSIDPKIKVETNAKETVTKKENNFEFETENWLKLQNDIRNLKLKRENNKHKFQRNEIEIATTGNETQEEHKKKLNQELQTETRTIENKDLTEKLQSVVSNLTFNSPSSRTETEIETLNSEESSEISGYYSQVSIDELNSILEVNISTENYFHSLNEQIKPLTNSTLIDLEGTNDNETQEFQTAANIFDDNETYELEINNKTNEIETNNEYKDFIPRSPKKYPFYKPENFQIPLIIINEIDIIHHGLKTCEIETKSSKLLQVPLVPIKTPFAENKELQKKLVELKLFKQIEIKDKVMSQLLEIAAAIDFPKLKHLCNLMCERNENGSCRKLKLEEKRAKEQEGSGGFFSNFWSAIKQPFKATSNKREEKVETSTKKEVDKEKISKENKMEEKLTGTEESINEDKENGSCLEAPKDKLDSNEENLENIKFPNRLVGAEHDKFQQKCSLEQNEDIKEVREIKNSEENKQDIKIETKENTEDFKDSNPKDSETNHVTKTIEKTEDFLEKEKTVEDFNKPIPTSDKIEETNNNSKTKSNIANNFNSNKKTNSSSTHQSENLQSNKKSEQDKKKSKKKKGFFSFFSKSQKTKKDKTKTTKGSITDEINKIDNMEEFLEKLEEEENKLKLEKSTKISAEALKKLEMVLSGKVLEQNAESKERMKRAGSF